MGGFTKKSNENIQFFQTSVVFGKSIAKEDGIIETALLEGFIGYFSSEYTYEERS